jgi:hypothetical protein
MPPHRDLAAFEGRASSYKGASISCSGSFFRKGSRATVSQQASFEGTGGADFIEVVAPTDSPQSLYAYATRPFNTCSATPTARIGPDTVVIRRSTHTDSVLYILVATPERLEVLGGVIAEALYYSDPSLFPSAPLPLGEGGG